MQGALQRYRPKGPGRVCLHKCRGDTKWLIFIGGRSIVVDYPCAKFGDCSFSRFGFTVPTDRHTESHTQTRLIAILMRPSAWVMMIGKLHGLELMYADGVSVVVDAMCWCAIKNLYTYTHALIERVYAYTAEAEKQSNSMLVAGRKEQKNRVYHKTILVSSNVSIFLLT